MYCPHCAYEQPDPPATTCVSCGKSLGSLTTIGNVVAIIAIATN